MPDKLIPGSDGVVIDIDQATAEAYREGYAKFEDYAEIVPEGEEKRPSGAPPLSVFKDGAEWANHISPRLRCMAGYDDSGYGTWQVPRNVVVLEPHEMDDDPSVGVVMDSVEVFRVLMRVWDRGAIAAIDGEEPQPYEENLAEL